MTADGPEAGDAGREAWRGVPTPQARCFRPGCGNVLALAYRRRGEEQLYCSPACRKADWEIKHPRLRIDPSPQFSLFGEEPTAPYQPHSETSREAANAVPASRLRETVYGALAAAPDGLTDEEIQVRLRMNPSTQRPRRIELVQQNRVADSGRTRLTVSGRRATVWVVR